MASTSPILLKVRDLTVDFEGRRVLDGIGLVLRAGEFLGVIGPNGGGKTTFLRTLVGIVRPTSGEVLWGGEAGNRGVRLGYVPQNASVPPHFPLCAREVVLQGVGGSWPLWGRRARAARELADRWLGRLGLAGREDALFTQLSGGQQRRALLARSLMNDPDAVLLDEPTTGVDVAGQEQFCRLLRDLARDGLTLVLVSHDIPLAMRYTDRIACLARTLHWHGPAGALERETVHQAFHCELSRFWSSEPDTEMAAAGEERNP